MAITLDGTNGITHSSGTNQKVSLASGTAVASTSGTSVDFILSADVAPYVKRITVIFDGVSTNGTSVTAIQIGSGSVQTSGYVSTGNSTSASGSAVSTSTSRFVLSGNTAATYVSSGIAQIALLSGNTWAISSLRTGGTGSTEYAAGSVTLTGTIDRIRITTVNGTDTFDAGSINILYE